jgi:hypothetical protein
MRLEQGVERLQRAGMHGTAARHANRERGTIDERRR